MRVLHNQKNDVDARIAQPITNEIWKQALYNQFIRKNYFIINLKYTEKMILMNKYCSILI